MRKLLLTLAVGASLTGCTGMNALGPDKFKHAAVGVIIGTVSEELGMTEEEACGVVIFAGIAKEIIDPIFTPMDVVATMMYCSTLLEKETTNHG